MRASRVFPLLGLAALACSTVQDSRPITGKITVSVPEVRRVVEAMRLVGVAPIIHLESEELFPTLCYEISYSKHERSGGNVLLVLGDAFSDAEACATALGPATAVVALDSAAGQYMLAIVFRESIDRYRIEIEPDRIRLVPVELHFTVPGDSVWLRE